LVVAFFQAVVIREVPDNLLTIVLGLGIVGFGLALFIRGLEMGIFPVGERLAKNFIQSKRHAWVFVFAFVIGFVTTIAEPALIAIADKAAVISEGRIDAFVLRLVVAVSVGFAILLGVLRIFLQHPIHLYILAGYGLVIATTTISPINIVGLAFDLGGITTSTVTVPLVAALGIGLATYLENRHPIIDGFGLIAFASLTPMIFVQFYGILVYNFDISLSFGAGTSFFAVGDPLAFLQLSTFGVGTLIHDFLSIVLDALPIVIAILFFQYVVLRKKFDKLRTRAFGFLLVFIGLYSFVVGLEMGLFPIGEAMAVQLVEQASLPLIYIFAFAIGFATTMAEPALIAIAGRVQFISNSMIKQFSLRAAVAFGVGIGLVIGSHRIIEGDSIVWYIAAGYVIVMFLTHFAPRMIIPIAYDTGGVTTSTVTVPLVVAFGIGLATVIPGRDPLIDGFGLIAFASLFPIITVLIYGMMNHKHLRTPEDEDRSKNYTRLIEYLGWSRKKKEIDS